MSDISYELDTTKDVQMVQAFESSLKKLHETLGLVDKTGLNQITTALNNLSKTGNSNLQALAKGAQGSLDIIQNAIDSLGNGSKAFKGLELSQKTALAGLLTNLKVYLTTQEQLLAKSDATSSGLSLEAAKRQARLDKEQIANKAKDLAAESAAWDRALGERSDAYKASLEGQTLLAKKTSAEKIASQKAESAAWDAALADQTASYKASLEGQTLLAKKTSAEKIASQKAESAAWDAALADQTASYKASLEGQVLLKKLNLEKQVAATKAAAAAEDASFAEAAAMSKSLGGQRRADNIFEAALNSRQDVKALSMEFDLLGKNSNAVLSGIARGFGLISSSIANIVPMLAGFAIAAGTMKALKVGTEFETSMFVIKELAGNSTEEVNGLSKALLDLGRTSQYGPLEAAKGVEILTLAGLTLKDAMVALKPTLDFAAAGGVSLDAAAATLVAVSTAYGFSAKAFGTVGDVIAKTAAESMASVQGMSESFKAASVVAQTYGVSLQDTAFILASLSQIGIQGSAAGTSMRNFYTEITKQSGKAFDALKKFKVEVYEKGDEGGLLSTLEIFKQISIATNDLSIKGKQKFFADISNERGGKSAAAVEAAAELQIRKDLNLENSKAALTVQQLSEGYDTLIAKQKDYIKNAAGFDFLASLEKSLTTLGTYKGLLASLESDFIGAFQNSSDAVYILGTTLRKALNSEEFKSTLDSVVSGVVALASAISDSIGFINKYSSEILVAVGALGVLVLANAAAISSIGATIVAFSAMVAESVSALALFVGFTGPIGLMVGAVALLSLGAYQLASGWTSVAEEAEKAARKQDEVTKDAIKALDLKIAATSDAIDKEIDAVGKSNAEREKGATKQAAADKAFGEAAIAQLDSMHQQLLSRIAYNAQLSKTADLQVLIAQNEQSAFGDMKSSASVEAGVSAKTLADIDAENNRYSGNKLMLEIKIKQLKEVKAIQAELDVRDAKKPARTGTDDNVKEPKAKKPKATREYSDVTLPQDNSLAQLMQRHRLAYDEISKHEANVESLLKAKEQAHLITEGAYQAELFKVTRQAENDKLELIERTADKANILYQFRKEDIQSTIDKATAEGPAGARKVQQYTAALERLNEVKKTEEATLDTEKANLADKRYTTMELAAIKAQGAIYDLAETERKYWKADAEALKKAKALDAINDKYRIINTSVFSLDEASKAGDIASADALEKHAAHIAELSDAYVKAMASSEAFYSVNKELLTAGDIEAISLYEGLVRKQSALDKAITDGRNKASNSAAESANLAFNKVRKDQVEKLASDISNALVDGLFSGGKAGATAFRNLVIAELKKPVTMLVNVAVNALMSQVSGFLGGSNISGANGFLSNVSQMGSVGNNVAEFFGFTGSGVAGMPSAASAVSAGSAYSGALAGGATEGAAVAAAGTAGAGAASTLSTVAPYALAAYAAYNIISSMDNGKGAPKTEGGYSNLGKTIYSYGGNASDLKAKGIVDSLTTGYDNIVNTVGAKGSLTGSSWISTDPNGRSNTQLDVQAAVNGKEVYNRGKVMGGIENVGKSDAELQAAVALSTSAALIEALKATDLSPALNAYLAPVTTAGKSIEELTQILSNVTATAELTKYLKALPFAYLKNISVEASVALLKAAGGLSTLSSDLNAYYADFYTAPEKTAIQLDYVTKALKDLGITMPTISATTKAWYRSEVERLGAMDLSVEANAKAYASALKLSTTINALAADFDATAAAALAVEKNRQSWQDKLSVLVGIKTAAQVQLEQDLASTTDEATKAIIRQVYRQQSLKDAVAAAIVIADAAYASLDRAISAQKTLLNTQKAALNLQLTTSTTLVSTLSSVFKMLGTSIDSLYGNVAATASMQVTDARAILTQALSSGVIPAESVLSSAISTLTANLNDNNYSSSFDKNVATLTLASTLTGIQTLTGSQTTIAQQQLAATQESIDIIDKQLTTLDETLATAKLQLDALKGIDTSVLSVADALKAFLKGTAGLGTANTNLASGTASFVSGPGGAVTTKQGKKGDGSGNFYTEYADPSGQYQVQVSGASAVAKYTGIQTDISNIGANPAALAAYAKDNNLSINDLATASGYLYSDVYALFSNAGIPRFAAGGDHAGGWRLVGENGPELENIGPSRIYNAAITSSMLGAGNDDTAEQLLSMRDDMRAQAGATVRLQADFVKILNRWDANGMPETRVTT